MSVDNKTIDHVDCDSCGANYDAERKNHMYGPTCCGACGCDNPDLVHVKTIKDSRLETFGRAR